MKVVFYPEFKTLEEFNDIYYRCVWHFNHAKRLEVNFLVSKSVDVKKRGIPASFDKEIAKYDAEFFDRVAVSYKHEEFNDLVQDADVIMKWQEVEKVNNYVSKLKNKRVYRVDPARVRQEGSFYIQCVFDTSESLVKESRASEEKFERLANKIGECDSSWVLATGPSVEEYTKHNFDNSLVIACNSTVLDDELFNKTNPQILVFADPIFHFGVSRYASEFRKIALERLKTSDINIVVPLKYYSLLTSVFKEYADRIIGLEFDNKIDFNLNLKQKFKVKTTSNILTLLLLPLATTFSKNVNVLGCDGRPFENDDYFWGHGKSVQINSEMGNIQEVHPGFFKIDYNEYYFEHCHILDVMIDKASELGIKVKHLAPSYIPALRDTIKPIKKDFDFDKAVILEPDGIGLAGHYVPWHNQLIAELKRVNQDITVLCNKKQDCKLYDTSAVNVFTSHSWAVSRSDWAKKKNFPEHASYMKFEAELEHHFIEEKAKYAGKVVSLFCYYGSLQILNMLNNLKRKSKTLGFELRVSLCLFHESVILNDKQTEPALPPQSRTVLLEALAQRDVYNVRAVTERLGSFLYDSIEVKLGYMANPLPASGDYSRVNETRKNFTVLFPCALRPEKGSEITRSFINHAIDEFVDFSVVSRFIDGIDYEAHQTLNFMQGDIDNETYRRYLDNSDIIVIPYLAPHFSYRTSGIIVDSMLAGKPVIVLDGTWLSDIVKTYKFGLSIKYFSHLSLVSAINVIKANYQFFLQNAQTSYGKYYISNNWSHLVADMFSNNRK